MKPQDIIFIIVLLLLLWKQNPKWFIVSGLISLIVSIPLFSFWIFFTAERLVLYAAGLFLVGIGIFMLKKSDDDVY